MPASKRDRLIIFSRYPLTGKTKTRMIPVMGAEGAAELQRRMTEYTLATAIELKNRYPLEIEIHFEDGNHNRMRQWLGSMVSYRRQAPGDIGERMRLALAETFAEGTSRAVLIGTDIPGITADLLLRAYAILDSSDFVFGPAADGGYYLIGADSRPFFKNQDTLFDGIRWGSHEVLEQTLAKVNSAGATAELVDSLTDVDRPSDLPVWISRARSRNPGSARPAISVIMPTLNEADHIGDTLAAISGQPDLEILVIDGGSVDGTVPDARLQGASVFRTPPSKAGQMNTGAALARGDILLFLHADTRLPEDFVAHARQVIDQAGVAAGAFRLGIGAPGPRLRFIEKVANLRSRYLQMPYGDQAIFMTAETFGAVGGFPNQPIMEDFDLIRRLRRRGKIVLAPSSVSTSPRRWLIMGVFRTWLTNQLIVGAYLAGIPPTRLARWYKREKGNRLRK